MGGEINMRYKEHELSPREIAEYGAILFNFYLGKKKKYHTLPRVWQHEHQIELFPANQQ